MHWQQGLPAFLLSRVLTLLRVAPQPPWAGSDEPLSVQGERCAEGERKINERGTPRGAHLARAVCVGNLFIQFAREAAKGHHDTPHFKKHTRAPPHMAARGFGCQRQPEVQVVGMGLGLGLGLGLAVMLAAAAAQEVGGGKWNFCLVEHCSSLQAGSSQLTQTHHILPLASLPHSVSTHINGTGELSVVCLLLGWFGPWRGRRRGGGVGWPPSFLRLDFCFPPPPSRVFAVWP
jgi:hypothetical protein